MIGAIDLGGTRVRVAVADADGRVKGVRRTATAALAGPDKLVEWAAQQLLELGGGRPPLAVGVGAPGPLDSRRGLLVNPPNLAGWRPNLPLGAMLSRALGAVPVLVENDAKLAAIGERARGAGRGSDHLVYVTWSTGIGSGLVLGGRLHTGAHGTAGEIGHMILDPNGPVCACGQRGCLEAFAGGAGLKRRTGRSAAELCREAFAGNAESRAAVEQAASRLGQALVNLTNLVDPQVIVVGGGLTRSWGMLRPIVWEAIRTSPFISTYRRPRLVRTQLGDRVGLVGAIEWARLHV